MLSSLCAFLALAVADNDLPKEPLVLSGAVDLTGKEVTVATDKSKWTVLAFISHDCPIANRYAPEIGRIYGDYKEKGVKFYRVYMGGTELAEKCVEHGKEFELTMPGLIDYHFKLAKMTGARVTPEVAVIDSAGFVRYRGRIDDQNVEHGKVREGYRRDLRVALDELLAGKAVSMPTTAAVGCFIPFED